MIFKDRFHLLVRDGYKEGYRSCDTHGHSARSCPRKPKDMTRSKEEVVIPGNECEYTVNLDNTTKKAGV